MRLDLDAGRSLDQGLLRLYRQALAERRWEIAEHLLSALEELAKTEPACGAAVEQAYLCISYRESLPTRRGLTVQIDAPVWLQDALTCPLMIASLLTRFASEAPRLPASAPSLAL